MLEIKNHFLKFRKIQIIQGREFRQDKVCLVPIYHIKEIKPTDHKIDDHRVFQIRLSDDDIVFGLSTSLEDLMGR